MEQHNLIASGRGGAVRLCTILIASFAFGQVAQAFNLNGAWATNKDVCAKVFEQRSGKTYLSREADFYGSGFVVDGRVLRGKMAMCRITSQKDDGSTVRLQASCATDVMVSSNKIDFKIVDGGKLIRVVPGMPEMDTPYYRCAD
jgi:hypothetical protein